MESHSNRRRGLRLRAAGKGHFAVLGAATGNTVYSGRFVLEDASAQGARIEIEGLPQEHLGPLVAGQYLLTVLFDEIIGSPVKAEAKVRWVQSRDHSYVMGLEFSAIAADHREKLQAFLFRLLDQSDATAQRLSENRRRWQRRAAYAAIAAAAGIVGMIVGRQEVSKGDDAKTPPGLHTHVVAQSTLPR
jgi:hypothetical protein